MTAHQTSKRRRLLEAANQPAFPFVAAGLALTVYLFLAWAVLGTDAVWSPDTGAKIMQVKSLRLEQGSPRWDLIYPGRDLDPELIFANETPVHGLILSVDDGRLLLRRMPVFSVLVWPLYRLAGDAALPILPALCGAAIGALTLLLVPAAERRWWMWGLVAWASPVAIYSTIFWEHTLASVLVLAGAVRLLRSPPGNAMASGGVGLLHATAVYVRQEVVLFAGTFLLAVVLLDPRRRRGAILAGIVVAGAVLLFPVCQQLLFGDPVPQNATHLIRPGEYLSEAGWSAVPGLLIGPHTHGGPDTGWVGVLWAWSTVVAFALGWWRTRSSAAILLLSVTGVAAAMLLFHGQTYQAAHGLLLTSPWVAWALYRTPELWRSGGRARLIVAAVLLGLAAYSVAILVLRGSTPDGGREWGARFAIPLFPLLAVVAAWPRSSSSERVRHGRGRGLDAASVAGGVAIGLFLLGVGFQVRGLSTIDRELSANRALNQALADLPESLIVTDVWWLALNAVPADLQPIFIVNDRAELDEWLRIARDAGVSTFAYVTFEPRPPPALASMVRSRSRHGSLELYSVDLGLSDSSERGSSR